MSKLRERRLIWVLLLWLCGLFQLPGASQGRSHQPARETGPSHSGSDDQIGALVAQYGRLVFAVAFAVTHNKALAEEVVQDTMFKAWTSMPSWDGDVPVKWVRTVARHGAISVMRKEGRTTAYDEWESRESLAPGTERLVEGKAMAAAMREALTKLDQASRSMIVLRETEAMSYEEIAELLEMTPSAVKTKLYRARHQLKNLLREWEL